jgi:hypothetical protein
MIAGSTPNAFSPDYETELVWTATPRETQLFASSKAAREKLVLANTPNCTFKVTAETWAKEEATC